ncbi:MAG TPA: hypothetical protein VGB55_01665, partial [Tepidisphaeraceae bacterium]
MTATIPQPNSSPSAADEADVLVENLAALWSVEPALAAMLDAVPDDLKISLIPARSGSPTAAVDNGAGQTIHLHSRYDPQDEAAKLVARHPADENCHVLFVLGFGLGYHVKAFSERSSEATLWVFEPNVAVVLAALSVCDFSKAILD